MTEDNREIKSLAFFDLETTGIPEWEYLKTKITELSIVVVSKEHFLESSDPLPRVLQKLTLCFNPFKRICLKSEEITGLSNELLEREKKFDENAGRTILGFLQQMQQPCVLVAHNGDKFDFPILKKAFEDISLDIPESILVVDSLPIFKDIDMVEEVEAGPSVTSLDPAPELETAANEFVENEKQEARQAIESEAQPSSSNSGEPITNQIPVEAKGEEAQLTPQQRNETTPKHQRIFLKAPPGHLKRKRLQEVPKQPPARKNLFGKSYKLSSIFERFHGQPPEASHYAESDVITLLKCASTKRSTFVELVQRRARPFSTVKKLQLGIY